jgi:hypothetical protein
MGGQMRLLLILLLLECAVIPKGSPLSKFAKSEQITATTSPVFVILNQEAYSNGYKGKSDFNYYHLLDQIKTSGLFPNITNDLEKAEQIIEIEIQTRRTHNRILPFLSVFTLSLVPYFQRIEIKENLLIRKKTGEIIYDVKRVQNRNYWFGFFFFVKGLIQLTKETDHNRFGFENEIIERMNQNIIDEMSTLKLK